MSRRVLLIIIALVVIVLVVLQFVPGYARTNPPVTNKINWNSPETEQLMREACMDCHSNETVWPWYSQIAPVSWLVVKDVDEGREALNISTGSGEFRSEEMTEKIQSGEMPPSSYIVLHPDARLTDAQKTELIAGLEATFGAEGGEGGEGNG